MKSIISGSCLLLFLLIGGCNRTNSSRFLSDLFPTVEHREIEELRRISPLLSGSGRLVYLDSMLFVTQSQSESLLSVIDLRDERLVGYRGHRGKSGSELLMTSSAFVADSSIGIYDPMSKRIAWFDPPHDRNMPTANPTRVIALEIHPDDHSSCSLLYGASPLPDGGYIAECSTAGKERFVRIDSTGRNYLVFGEYAPDVIEQPSAAKKLQRSVMSCGFMATCKNIFLHVAHNRNEWLFYRIPDEPNQQPELIRKYDLGVPDNRTDEAFMASFDVAASDSLFFVLYRGRWFRELNLKIDADQILVFNTEGHAVKRFSLDKPVIAIAASPDSKTLYALGIDHDSGDPRIYKFLIETDTK